MNTFEAIQARHSIRKYQKGVVIPQEHVEQLLEAGQTLALGAGGQQEGRHAGAQRLQFPSLGICRHKK